MSIVMNDLKRAYLWINYHRNVITPILSLMLVVATCILAGLTWGYLNETKQHRLLFQKIVALQTKPKVFVKDIKGKLIPVAENKAIVLEVLVSNCRDAEARDIVLHYEIVHEEEDKIKGAGSTIGGYKYLFPGKDITIPIEFPRSKRKQDSEKPKSYMLNIKIEYNDSFGPCEPLECAYEFN